MVQRLTLQRRLFLFSAMAEANGLFAIYWAVFMQIPPTLYKI
jgi:F0F1-type ATP synthase membrane subunit c/vacuolar-type H+-ATPase subunit K